MVPLLALEAEVFEFAQKAGLAGLLFAGVVILWRTLSNERGRRDAERDVALSNAQAQAQIVAKELTEARLRWAVTLEQMATVQKTQAEMLREIADELRNLRERLDDQPARPAGRRPAASGASGEG